MFLLNLLSLRSKLSTNQNFHRASPSSYTLPPLKSHHHHHRHHHHPLKSHHLDFHNLNVIERNVIHILTPRGFPVDVFKFRAASTLFFPFLQLLLHQSGLQSTLVLSEIKDTYNQLVFAINTRG